MKLTALLLFLLALLVHPETSLNAAREAMLAWYTSVAPALFPFMALMPMLTSPPSLRAWERLTGRWMRPLLNLSGSSAPAVVIAMIAGSPAGTLAAARTCRTQGELTRVVCCAGGLSPAFLVGGIGAAMLGSPAAGHVLLRAQLLAQLTLLLLTRTVPPGAPHNPSEDSQKIEPVRAAVLSVLTVCGYMMLFSVLAALLSRILRSETAGLTALCLLDAPSGARALAAASINNEGKMILLAALTGFGGLCIAVQNLSACAGRVKLWRYLAVKACCAALTAAFTALQLRRNLIFEGKTVPALEISALAAVILIVPALFSWKKDPFLNKRNFEKTTGFPAENREKPQDVVAEAE